MSVPINKVALSANSDPLGGMSRSKGKTMEAEKARLRKATEEFEAFFSHQMLKTMRATIPKSEDGKEGPFSNNLGKDTWTDMFDMEVARAMAGTGQQSISDALFSSLERLVEIEFGQAGETAREITPLNIRPATEDIRREPLELPQPTGPIPLPVKPEFKVAPRSISQADPSDTIVVRYGDLIDMAAAETKLDSTLIASVIEVESAGDQRAVSPAGAKGLMQLMDGTASDLGVTDPFDPRQNILAGSRFLKRMVDRFGDLELALAAYNAGPGNVDKHGGIPPFRETQAYVEKVTARLSDRMAK